MGEPLDVATRIVERYERTFPITERFGLVLGSVKVDEYVPGQELNFIWEGNKEKVRSNYPFFFKHIDSPGWAVNWTLRREFSEKVSLDITAGWNKEHETAPDPFIPTPEDRDPKAAIFEGASLVWKW